MKTSKILYAIGALSISLSSLLAAPQSAHAHLKIGTYSGQDARTGEPCSVEIRTVRFEGNVRHPINERVEISHSGKTWVLHHPALINATEGTVRPSSDTLEAAQGTPGAADAFQLVISHAPGKDGPTAFYAIHDNYKDANQSIQVSCHDLVFQQ